MTILPAAIFAGCATPRRSTHSETSTFAIVRGVNISHWLSQSVRRGAERAAFFTEADVAFIASLGYDHIRLPVDEEQLWNEAGARHRSAFDLLHDAIRWAEAHGLRVVVDLHILRAHHFNQEERLLWFHPAEQERFVSLWLDLSAALRAHPNHLVAYELMNEPVAEDPDDWNRLVARTMAALRPLEPERKIVIGSNRWQSVNTFDALRVPPNDPHIILSFHFYEPFLLTHHRARWTRIRDYEGPVAYPGPIIDATTFAAVDAETRRTIAPYVDAFDRASLETMLEQPLRFAREHDLPLYCGEWGCLPTVPEEARMRWYADARSILEARDIAWANWDYKGGFGIVDRGTGGPNKRLIRVLLD